MPVWQPVVSGQPLKGFGPPLADASRFPARGRCRFAVFPVVLSGHRAVHCSGLAGDSGAACRFDVAGFYMVAPPITVAPSSKSCEIVPD